MFTQPHSWIGRKILSTAALGILFFIAGVNTANCLIRKVLEMGIVASNKKVLEINETYRQWQGPRGGKDEAYDATAASGSGQSSGSVSTQPEEREELDLERVGGADGVQSRLCAAGAAPTWSTSESGQTNA